MPRGRSPNREKAYEIYKKNNGKITNKEIAMILSEKEKTISNWKCRDKWDCSTTKKECSTTKEKVNKKSKRKEVVVEEVKEVLENTELTDKQRLFCVIYSQCLNATKAYQKAYHCTYETAMVEGCKSLKKPKIKEQIDKLIAPVVNKEFLKRGVLQKYIDIAFSDIGDYLTFGKKSVPQWTKNEMGDYVEVIDPNTGEQKVIEYSYVDLKESKSVDTSLIAEVSEGKDGIKFKLADKMKALDFLRKHCDLLDDEQKAKLDIENKKLQNAKLKAEINRIDESDNETNYDDGFIKALEGKADEVWQEEK